MTKTMMKMLGVAGLLLAAGLARAEPAEYVDESGRLQTNTTFAVVTAEGGQYGAGIGCGYAGLGGEVVISGGRVNAIAGRSASRIGRGLPQESACSVAISGGVFAHEPEVDWLADGYGVFANPDPTTCADYPYVVLSYKGREKGRMHGGVYTE